MKRSSVLMIASGMLVTLVTVALARLSFGLILPPMRQALDLSYEQAGRLGTATALGYLALVMVAGALAASRGGRLSILIGLGLATGGFTGLSLATDYRLILVLMTVLGFATAFAYTPLISLFATWFPQRRGLVIGLLNSGVGTGMMTAGWVVPYLTQTYPDSGWRISWALFAVMGGLATTAGVLFLRNPPRPHSAQAGSMPSVDRTRVFRNPYVVTVGLIYGIIGMTYIVQAIFMYSFALDAGVPALTAGRLAAVMGMLGIVFGPVWGTISDRLGRANSLMLAVSLAFVSTLIPVVAPTLTSFAAHYLILGVCVTGMFTSSLAASTERVAPHEAPLAVSFVTLFFAGGQLLGPAGAGALIGSTGEFRMTFGISASLLLVGMLLCIRLIRLKAAAPAMPGRDLRAG
ncbi:MFS transporter [Salinisphaera aquimarina]|uniref:MFS transporter n=1 Tax=Salinisphaera aquimarina TaxID=2094031 RepID=A0ABV7EXL9_9GAMM